LIRRQKAGSTNSSLGRLKQLGITPAKVCSDGVFVRRAYLDVIGTLPRQKSAAVLEGFRPRQTPQARHRLLEREEFADYWAMKWCDLLRVKSEFPIKLWPNAVQAYHRWIARASRRTCPTTGSWREMLTASAAIFAIPK